eukprot:gene13758-biopygen1459
MVWVKVFCSSIGRLPLRKVPIDSGSILAEKSLKSGMPSSVESEHGVVLRSCFPKKGIMFVGLIEKMKLKLRSAGNIEGFDFELDSRALFLPTNLDGLSPPSEGGAPSAIVTPSIAVNLAEPADVLEFLVDGVLLATGPGAGSGDTLVNFFSPGAAGVIPPGRHRVQLRFRKDFTGADAQIRASTELPFDGALIDDIKFIPDNNFEAFVSQYGAGFDPNPESDADGDGYSNHQEYAFGGDVLIADIPSYLPQLVVDGELSYIEYGVDPSRPDLNYTAQQSTDLENWQPVELSSLHRLE